ncbi:MAG: AlkA N-terminal domain-containing protein [Thermomicrobiales bacterium]
MANTHLTLQTTPPYNLQATVRLLQRRPTNRVDRWDSDGYRRVLPTAHGPRLLHLMNVATTPSPDLHLQIHGGDTSPEALAKIVASLRHMLGLDAPPAPEAALAAIEPHLAPVLNALDGFRTPCFPTLFETCASILPFQQLSLDAGTAIVGRLVEGFGVSMVLDGTPWYCFPTPQAIAEAPPDHLRATGLSRSKVAALQGLARMIADGSLSSEQIRALSTPDALAALKALPGIGPWSANLILLRGFRRLDVFPEGDVGAARNLTALVQPPTPFTPEAASAFAAQFGDQRGYLYFLALGNQLRAKGLLGPAPAP